MGSSELLRGMKWNHVEAIPTLVPQPCCYPRFHNHGRVPAREKMHMSHTMIPRRTVLLGATAVGLGAAAGFRIPTSEARAPIVSGQVPYFYRLRTWRKYHMCPWIFALGRLQSDGFP